MLSTGPSCRERESHGLASIFYLKNISVIDCDFIDNLIEISIDQHWQRLQICQGHFKLRASWHLTYFNLKANSCQHASWSELTLTQTTLYSVVDPCWIRKHSPTAILWNLPYWSGSEPDWMALFKSWCRLRYCVPLHHSESGVGGVIH